MSKRVIESSVTDLEPPNKRQKVVNSESLASATSIVSYDSKAIIAVNREQSSKNGVTENNESKSDDCTNANCTATAAPPIHSHRRQKTKERKKGKKEKNSKTAAKKPPPKGERFEKCPSFYFTHNNMRYVAPYDFEYKCYAKGRWFGRQIFEVMTKEFVAYDADYYRQSILSGRITVCDKIVALDYIIKNGDWIIHKIHRHEPPVTAQPIKIAHDCKDFIVINKPSSIPVHPAGKYRYNSLVYILFNEFDCQFSTAHRLDRVTSGLMIVCRNAKSASEMGKKIRERNVRKTYLARVKGKFPNGIIRVNQPIATLDHRIGVQTLSRDGKEAITDFRRLSFNGKTSLVECKPMTGRTHQIRIHLQYTGHSIVNDFGYGGVRKDAPNPCADDSNHTLMNVVKKQWREGCGECITIEKEISGEYKNPRVAVWEIYLHALKYECEEWSFEVDKPYWAHPDFKD